MLSSTVLRRSLVLFLTCLAGLCGCGSGVRTAAIGGGSTSSAQLTVSPSTFASFGSVVQGLASPPQVITLTNSGSAAVTITSITSTGDFNQSSSACTGAISAGSNCQIAVTFSPTATGARTGTLTITSNAMGSPLSFALAGTGTPAIPQLSLSYQSLNFGTITTGQSSAPWVITATNTGTAALVISNISITGDFSETATGCSSNLAPAASCQIAVAFTPAATGARTGALTISSNATPATQTVALTGTGATFAAALTSSFQLMAQAGTIPIVGATVTLYSAGTKGNGSTPTTLLTGPLLTNASGAVTIPAAIICPAGVPLYAVSRGGSVSGAANSNIALMTALGSCSSLLSGAKFVIDEATTVAAVEALAQFYAPGGLVGSSDSNLTGIANAFATAATLADSVAGTSPGSTLPANVVASPAPRIHALANILHACVVSAAACPALYAASLTTATNTLDAAWYVATHPTANVAGLYAQSQLNPVFAPALTAAPRDWTVFLSFSGGGMSTPTGLGVDSAGSVWVASYFYAASKFTPTGAAVFASGITGDGLNNSYGLAIDTSNNVWIPNEQPFNADGSIGSVTELTSTGSAVSGFGYIAGGMNYPIATAVDPNGTVWVIEYGTSHVSLISPTGAPLSGTGGYFSSNFAFPVAVAIDANHFGWVVNQSSNSVAKVAPDGSTITGYSCCNLASGVAIDQGDNVWVADYFGDSISLLTNAGTVIASDYNAGGAIYHPQGIAVDGAGNVWVANYRAPFLTELSGSTTKTPGAALAPSIGGDANLVEAYALSLDASGNIWVSNSANNTLTKFIGLAVPVRTPLSGLPQLP